jgi:hypothetical protein
MSKKSENLSDLNKKDRNKRHSSPFIHVVKGVFFVVRVTLVPVSYYNNVLSCNQYICCTIMLYEYIFALFVLDEYTFIVDKYKIYLYEL